MKFRHLFIALISPIIVSCTDVANKVDNDTRLNAIDRIFMQGKYETALNDLSSYSEDYPNSYKAVSLTGWAHLKMGDLEAAERHFNKSLRINPEWDNAYTGMGVLHRKRGDLESARKAYQEAIRLEPDNPESYSSLLVIEIMEKDYETAVKYGEISWASRKDLATIPANLSIAYHYLGNTEKRDYFYQRAQELGYPRLNVLDEIIAGTMSIE